MDIREEVKKYYSEVTGEKEGQMETNICSCALDNMPEHLQVIREQIPHEIITRFYGCGSPIPPALDGCTVLDLGFGTGLDVYMVSKLVGEKGKVIGLDMNDDQLTVAKAHQDEMAEKFGYNKSNVTFVKGYIEDLKSAGIEDESVDVVISNCVINLSPYKEAVFSEIYRVLKKGGELYFSDIFADRRMPKELEDHPVLRGECIGGALYVEDFRRLMRKVGWEDFRYMSSSKAAVDNPEIEKLTGNTGFTSRTIRAMKLPDFLEDICEQYGQFIIYKGGIVGNEFAFDLDDHHHFEKDLPASVCGNTCAMIQETRFGKYFEVIGDRSQHFGPFEGCSTSPSVDSGSSDGGGCCC